MTKKVGILGGGQLGMMLIQEQKDLDISFWVLDPNPECSCARIADSVVIGDFNDFDDVMKFGESCDVITIEIEHVNTDALRALAAQGKTVAPSADIVELVKDKGTQKQWYKDLSLPTSDFIFLEKSETPDWDFPCIQKARTGGYDGKGVQKVNTPADLWPVPSILEPLVDIEKEISVIVARNQDEEIKTFPCVEMVFSEEANLVEQLQSPSSITIEQEERAQGIAKKIAEELKLVGILAVEMFLTKKGEILINEIAPRPHNSGHQSIEGNETSQFHQHLLAILNKPLGSTEITKPSVMLNVLGEPNYEGPAIVEGRDILEKMSETYLHLYNKTVTKPFRKMGHVTCLGDSMEKALEKAEAVKDTLRVIA